MTVVLEAGPPRTIVVSAPDDASFTDTVTAPSDEVVQHLARLDRQWEGQELTVTVVLIQTAPETSAFHEALFEAIRGVVGAVTIECAGRLRVNLVRSSSHASAEPTLVMIDGTEGAFVAGATLDLLGRFE